MKFLSLSGFAVVLLGLSGCGSLSALDPILWHLPGQVASIEKLHTRPRVDTVVYVRGTVGDRIPLLNAQIYQLQDQTGSIWVVTADSSIQTGETLVIKGRLRYMDIEVDDLNLGEIYLEEERQLERN